MKLIVGLGNPGSRYSKTRHNIGFEVLNAFAEKYLLPASRLRFDGLITEGQILGEKVTLLAPQTFMNASGRSVKQCVDFYKIQLSEVLVVVDDLNLELGRLRIRSSGSSGGQKGLADIIRVSSTESIPRLRFGIGRPQGRMDPADFVLQRFTKVEDEIVQVSVQQALAGLEVWIKSGLDAAMNATNAVQE